MDKANFPVGIDPHDLEKLPAIKSDPTERLFQANEAFANYRYNRGEYERLSAFKVANVQMKADRMRAFIAMNRNERLLAACLEPVLQMDAIA